MEKLMFNFFRIPVYHPKKTLLFLAAMTLFTLAGISKLQFENSLDAMMPKQDAEYIMNEQVKAIYGNNGKFIIMDFSAKDLWTVQSFSRFDALVADVEEYAEYDETREERRLVRFAELAAKGETTLPALSRQLSDDPPFMRAVQRKTAKLGYEKDTLSNTRLTKIGRELALTRDIKKREYVDSTLSPFTMKDLSGKNDTLTPYNLIEKDLSGRRILPRTAAQFKTFELMLRHNPAFKKGLYAEDAVSGRITDFGLFVRLIDLKDHDLIARELWDIAQSYNGDGCTVLTQGMPILYKQINDYMQSDLKFFVPLVLFVICFIFYLNFRTAQGVLIPLATLLIADCWVLGLMGHAGFKISVLGISLPPLIISVGSSYSIHIINRFHIDAKEIKKQGKKGLHSSMNMIGMTLLLASVTTVIGFATNMATQVSCIFEWGAFSAIGTVFAVVIAALFIPAVFTFIEIRQPAEFNLLQKKKDKNAPKRKSLTEKMLQGCSFLSVKHPRIVLGATVILAVISIAGIVQIKTETSLPSYFRSSDYINTSSCEIGRKFGGTMGLNILVDSGSAEGVKDPAFLKRMESFRAWLISPENTDLHVGRTDAFGDFVRTMNRAMHNDDAAFYSIPDSASDVYDYFEIYSGDDVNGDGRMDEFEPYVDPAFRTVNIFARLAEQEGAMLGTADIDAIVKKINAHAQKEFAPYGYKVVISGEPLIILSLAKYIVKGQLWSLFLSLLAVALVVILLFRNFKAGLVSSIPIIAAVLFNFGLMGWTDIRLDIATAIIASITVGIGVDNTIHFLNNYRHFGGGKKDIPGTIDRTLTLAGKAIIYAALALIFGFSVLVTSTFKPILLFGIMMGFTFVATTAGSLIILPAVINVTGFRMDAWDVSPALERLDRFAPHIMQGIRRLKNKNAKKSKRRK